MKYTRKEILQKTLPAGLLIFTPTLITLFNKYYINEFGKELEISKGFFSKNDLSLDMLIINYQSVKRYNWVYLAYNREYNDAPIIAMHKIKEYSPETGHIFKSEIQALKNFAQKHGIYTLVNHDNDILKRIIECGTGNCISDDLFIPVSSMYAEMYSH